MVKVSQFEKVIFLVNPASTHIDQAMKRLNELQKLFGIDKVELISTTSEGRQANIRVIEGLSGRLGSDTLLCVAAGDGTTSLVIETLVQSQNLSGSDRKTTILPLWGGNANDLAHMLNGFSNSHLRFIIERSQIKAIHPLEFKLDYKSGKQSIRIAACYASFGASAHVAHRLNEFGHRHSTLHKLPGGRLFQEASTSWDALVSAPTFAIKENDRYLSVYDCIFSNGQRVGKVYRMPVKLNEKRFYLDIIQGERGIVSASKLSLAFIRRSSSKKQLRESVSFTIQKATWAQFDGEEIEVPSGTKVEAGISELPFYALSTRIR